MEKPRTVPPRDLDAHGKRVWRAVMGVYVLDPAEVLLLHELCRTADELDRLTAKMVLEEPLVEGSQGQPKAHPLLGEIRAHRKLAETLALALALPADGETVGHRRSVSAAKAANARWNRGRGA